MAVLAGVKLTWINRSPFAEGINIYRSATPFDKTSLPEVYDTISGDATFYVDSDTTQGTTYYYLVSSFVGDKEVYYPAVREFQAGSLSYEIGDELPGGIYIGSVHLDASYGVDEGDWGIIMPPKPEGDDPQLKWKGQASDTPDTDDMYDGAANTLAMIDYYNNAPSDNAFHAAADYCYNFTYDGLSDFYLPAREELELFQLNRSVLTALDMKSSSYWCSTQSSSTDAHRLYLSNGSWYTSGKTGSYYVRPVRRLKLTI